MKKIYRNLRDVFVAGLVFLLPLLVLVVLLTKVFQFLTGFSGKVAGLFGLKSFAGISGGTIISTVSLILLCIICGYLVRISFFRSIRNWVDKQLMANIPGYAAYRETALAKLENKEAKLPYKTAAWVHIDNGDQPGFLLDTMSDGRMMVFVPRAGNVKEGAVYRLNTSDVELCPDQDMKAFQDAIGRQGIGLG